MASLSSSSVSSSNSLGNTSLRGFGGMMSGIDRDSIIEQMTLGTNTKIANVKKDMTRLQWKQEAYQSISSKIIDLTDKYSSYSSASSLVDPNTFAKSVITVLGSEKSSKYVSATGVSDLVDTVAISAVEKLASAAVRQSKSYGGALTTGLNDLDQKIFVSSLEGRQLSIGTFNETNGWSNVVNFAFPTQCQAVDEDGNLKFEADGKTKVMEDIEYNTTDYEKLAAQLNRALGEETITLDGKSAKLSDAIQFKYEDGQMKLVEGKTGLAGNTIRSSSSALKALGYEFSGQDDAPESIDLGTYNDNLVAYGQEGISHTMPTALDLLTEQKVTFNYDGSRKDIKLITEDEKKEIEKLSDAQEKLNYMRDRLQERLDRAFGTGNVEVNTDDGILAFSTKDSRSTVSITSGDAAVQEALGITSGVSSKINLDDTLNQNAIGIDLSKAEYQDGLVINGEKIEGIRADSSIGDIIARINESEAGVKATYVNATGQFMLISKETGEGRTIDLDSQLAKDLFGKYETEADGSYKLDAENNRIEEADAFTRGENAVVKVSYGNGAEITLSRATNSFELEGMSVTVSGVFTDPADRVTFSAKADVDAVTEKVKTFFEDYNAMVTEVYNQLTTRSDSSYGPLTEEQKDEMSETSITNWENKAKTGILYNDAIIRDLNSELEGIFVKMMSNGIDYQTMESIGITYDQSWDGGATTIVFNESKFRAAMENNPDQVADIFSGSGDVSTGLIKTIENTLTPFATRYASRNGGSYGRLVDEAGSEKAPTTVMNNFIYNQLKEMEEKITTLQSLLKTQQDRYISQFTSMESMINKYNSQSSYLSQISG